MKFLELFRYSIMWAGAGLIFQSNSAVARTSLKEILDSQQQNSNTSGSNLFPDDPANPRFTFQGSIHADFNVAPTQSHGHRDNLKLADSTIEFSAQINKYIRAQITLQLEHDLRIEGQNADQTFDVGHFIEEAYVEIRVVEDRPIAILIGKQRVPFGGQYGEMPAYYNTPLYDFQQKNKVFGFTVEMNQRFGLDVAEFSVFENKEDDLSIGTMDGVSMRLQKTIAKRLLAEASGFYKGNQGTGSDPESRASLGLIYKDENGLHVWSEATYLKNSEDFIDKHFGLDAGASIPAGRGRAVAEINWIMDSFLQLAAGYRFEINTHVAAGVEVRYTFAESVSPIIDGLSVGGNLEFTFGSDPSATTGLFEGVK